MTKKWALITGASSGIGESTSKVMFNMGYSLILWARREDRLQELKKNLLAEKTNQEVILWPYDVLDESASKKLTALNEFQNIEVLINNAGLAKGVDPLQSSKTKDVEDMVNINVLGFLKITQLLLPTLIKNKGHIVNIGSVAGDWTYPGGAVYCATKAAVQSVSEGIRLDTIGSGLRVTNIKPGMVATEFSVVRLGSQEKSDQVYKNMTPLKAEDIAETIQWILLRPKHVNIQEITIFPTDQAGVGYVHRRS